MSALVTFSVGTRRCALRVTDVAEVLRIVAVTPVANAPAFVEGVINRRGAITPVIDLRKRQGIARPTFNSTTHILIATVRGRHAGLIVDEVLDVVDAADGEAPVTVIDPAAILTDEEGRAFDAAQIP